VAAHSASPAVMVGHAAPHFASVGTLLDHAIVAHARLDFSEVGIRGPPAAL